MTAYAVSHFPIKLHQAMIGIAVESLHVHTLERHLHDNSKLGSTAGQSRGTRPAKLDTALAATSMWQTPSAIRYTAAPCHALVANVQMVVPLLTRQCLDSSELGTWTHNCLVNALL